MCDSHFLLLLDLLLLLLVVFHYLQTLRLHQATLLDVELFLSLQRGTVVCETACFLADCKLYIIS